MRESTPVLSASKRERLGTRYSQREREAGRLPIVVYAKGTEPLSLSVDAREAKRAINKGEKIFRMDLAGVFDKQTVLLKDVQFDFLGTEIVHADFARVSLDDRIRARVPIHLVGEAKEVSQNGGITEQRLMALKVLVKPGAIPDGIDADITDLTLTTTITAADLVLPAGVELVTDPEQAVVTAELTRAAVTARNEGDDSEGGDGDAEAAGDGDAEG